MRRFCAVAVGLACWAAIAWAGPLHDAARKGDVQAIEVLLEQGADPAEPDQTGEPALLIASLKGKTDVVELLLKSGATVNMRNKNGLTALHAAAYAGNTAVVELLIANGAGVNDAKNLYKMTPLLAAAEEGRTEVVALLLAKGADVEATERNGYTALTQAGWRSHWDTAGILMKAGAVCQKAELVGEPLYKECMKRK